MKIYKMANRTIYEGDRVSSVFNGKSYTGVVSEVDEENNDCLVTFDDFDALIEKSHNSNDKRLYALLDWMESSLHFSKLTMVQSGERWETQKNENQLDLMQTEVFSYYASSWDVREAKRIIHKKPRPTVQFPVSSVAYYATKGGIAIGERYKEANLSIPVILISSKGDDESGQFPIDGWHRIRKAVEEKVEFLPAYVLTEEESRSIAL